MDLQEFWLYFPQTQLPRGIRAQLIGPKPFDVRVWKSCEDVEQVCSSVTTSVSQTLSISHYCRYFTKLQVDHQTEVHVGSLGSA